MNILPYNEHAPKKATNLSINTELLAIARKHHVNLSQAMEKYLINLLTALIQKEWQEQNRPAIEEYNKRVRKKGVFSDGLRRF